MNVTQQTLEENFVYFRKELARIESEIKKLPVGNISLKRIGKRNYYYRQWREGKKVRTVSLGTEAPHGLLTDIKRRKLLESQRKEILSNLHIISKAIDVQKVTADEVVRVLSKQGIKVTVVGSFCLPVMKEELGLHLPTIKTQDIDFLIETPYRGKGMDIETVLGEMGFVRGLNPDGSTFFTNGVFKVEFLTPEKGRGVERPIYIKSLQISVVPLRYLQMLLDGVVKIEKGGYFFFIPSPWVFAYHKILVSEKRKKKQKGDKDLFQALAVLREVSKKPKMLKKAMLYLRTLPPRWRRKIEQRIKERDLVLCEKIISS